MLAIWALPLLALASQASVQATVLLSEDLTTKPTDVGDDEYKRWTLSAVERFGPNGSGMFIVMGAGCGKCGYVDFWGAWGFPPQDPQHDMKITGIMAKVNQRADLLRASAHTFASMEDDLNIAATGDWGTEGGYCGWRFAVVQAKSKQLGLEALKTALGCPEWFADNEANDQQFNWNVATGKGK